jgi:translation initiation factor IF-2
MRMAKEPQPLATVIHYFPHPCAAVIRCVGGGLRVGDTIRVQMREGAFEQVVESMQVDREQVRKVRKGTEVALQVANPVKEKDQVFLVKRKWLW